MVLTRMQEIGRRIGRSRALKPAVFALALVPLAELALRLFGLGLWGGLGANPVESLVRFSGDWAIRLLLVALAVTPLARLTGQGWIKRLRRMLGLFAFFYAALHVALYVGVDQVLDWGRIWADIVKRNYITVGFASFLILALLAVTSPKRVVKAMGGRRWALLHRTVYLAGGLAVLHYLMMVKADLSAPLVHGAVLAVLLACRLIPDGWTPAGRARRTSGAPLPHRS